MVNVEGDHREGREEGVQGRWTGEESGGKGQGGNEDGKLAANRELLASCL